MELDNFTHGEDKMHIAKVTPVFQVRLNGNQYNSDNSGIRCLGGIILETTLQKISGGYTIELFRFELAKATPPCDQLHQTLPYLNQLA